MTNKDNGIIAVVKRDCPTCELVEPVLKRLQEAGALVTVYSQDDPVFPESVANVQDDRSLEQSYHLDIEFVPTLIRTEDRSETGRVFGWNRADWEQFTGIQGIGEGLPDNQPGCGSKSVEPGIAGAASGALRRGAVQVPQGRVSPIGTMSSSRPSTAAGPTACPIVPPTDERILRMLQGTDRAPDEIVGIMPPDMKECTVEKIAINAVMAGARPEYMPVILAVVEAALEPLFTLHGVLCTLNFAGPVIVVNGPVTKSIGMNWGGNCLGQGNRANATIGRTLQLLVRNVGGGRPGEIDRAVFGNPGKYTYCFRRGRDGPGLGCRCTYRAAVRAGIECGHAAPRPRRDGVL